MKTYRIIPGILIMGDEDNPADVFLRYKVQTRGVGLFGKHIWNPLKWVKTIEEGEAFIAAHKRKESDADEFLERPPLYR